MVGCLLGCLGCLLRSFKFDTVVQMFATVLCHIPSSFLLRHRLVHSATTGAIGALVIDTLAASLLLGRVAVVLPEELVDMRFGRVDNLVDGLHLPTLALPLLICSIASTTACISSSAASTITAATAGQ